MTSRFAFLVALGLCAVRMDLLSAQGARPVRLVFDQAHGQQPPPPQLDTLAGKLGLEIHRSAEPLTPKALEGARLLYLRAPSRQFTEAESQAIVAFVKGGGSLLLVLDEEQRQSLEGTRVNSLIGPFGMRLTPDTEYLHNNGAMARAGEINKADREVPFSGGRAVEGGTAFAFQLDAAGKPAQPFGAYKRVDNGGRIVVLGEGMATLFLGDPKGVRLSGAPRDTTNTVYWGKDSTIFMEEVLAWLMGPASPGAKSTPPAGKTYTLSGEMVSAYHDTQRNLTEAAQKMAEEDYAFRPTPAIKPYGQLVAHAALSNFRTCAMLKGEPSPRKDEKEETVRTKTEAIALLDASVRYCDPLVDSVTETTVIELAKAGDIQVARGLLPASLITHGMEMYGTMAVYLRLKGHVPPTTERMNKQMEKRE